MCSGQLVVVLYMIHSTSAHFSSILNATQQMLLELEKSCEVPRSSFWLFATRQLRRSTLHKSSIVAGLGGGTAVFLTTAPSPMLLSAQWSNYKLKKKPRQCKSKGNRQASSSFAEIKKQFSFKKVKSQFTENVMCVPWGLPICCTEGAEDHCPY